MDEPTDGLDPVSGVRVKDIIRALSQRNIGVLMNSHLVDETQSACEDCPPPRRNNQRARPKRVTSIRSVIMDDCLDR